MVLNATLLFMTKRLAAYISARQKIIFFGGAIYKCKTLKGQNKQVIYYQFANKTSIHFIIINNMLDTLM